MIYEMEYLGWFTRDNIIFINILNFIFLNSKFKRDNSGMNVYNSLISTYI